MFLVSTTTPVPSSVGNSLSQHHISSCHITFSNPTYGNFLHGWNKVNFVMVLWWKNHELDHGFSGRLRISADIIVLSGPLALGKGMASVRIFWSLTDKYFTPCWLIPQNMIQWFELQNCANLICLQSALGTSCSLDLLWPSGPNAGIETLEPV